MEKKNIRNIAIGGLTFLVGTLGGCKTPEQIGYERTFVRLDEEKKLEVWTEYPRGIDKVEIYGDGDLIYTDNVNQYSDTLYPGGYLVITKRTFPKGDLTVRVTSPNGNSFKKTLRNSKENFE